METMETTRSKVKRCQPQSHPTKASQEQSATCLALLLDSKKLKSGVEEHGTRFCTIIDRETQMRLSLTLPSDLLPQTWDVDFILSFFAPGIWTLFIRWFFVFEAGRSRHRFRAYSYCGGMKKYSNSIRRGLQIQGCGSDIPWHIFNFGSW